MMTKALLLWCWVGMMVAVCGSNVPLRAFEHATSFDLSRNQKGAMAYTTAVDKDQNPIEPGGINGGFYKRKSKGDHPSFGVQTDSLDHTLKAIEKAGGKVITLKHSIGEWGFMADFADPEGNVITLWEKPDK